MKLTGRVIARQSYEHVDWDSDYAITVELSKESTDGTGAVVGSVRFAVKPEFINEYALNKPFKVKFTLPLTPDPLVAEDFLSDTEDAEVELDAIPF